MGDAWICRAEGPPKQVWPHEVPSHPISVFRTGAPREVARSTTERVYDVASARNADVLAIRCGDYEVRLYNGAGAPLGPSIELPHNATGIALSPDGELLAVTSRDGTLNLYELPTYRVRWSRTFGAGHAIQLHFAAGTDKLVVRTLSDNFVAVVNVANGVMSTQENIGRLRAPVGCVAVSPDGTWLATGSGDRAVRIWDLETQNELMCLQGRDADVISIAFSPDGRTLAAGTASASVTLWHMASGQELGTFKTPLASINQLSFSQRGDTLAIAGRMPDDSGQVVLWKTKAVDE